MAKIAYIRVSSNTQRIDRQVEQMPPDIYKTFIDIASGKSVDEREQLKACMAYVREGDTLYVESISRLARNTKDLLMLVEELTSKGVELISLKEQVDTHTAQGRYMLTIWAAMAEMEREYIKERQREGIEIAKAAGRYKGRKPIDVDASTFKRIVGYWKNGDITAVEAMRRLNMKPNTFYRRVKMLCA